MSKAYYNENDKFAANWLRNLINASLIADGDVDERSIVDVRPSDRTPISWSAGDTWMAATKSTTAA